MRTLFTDRWNSFWHVVLGILSTYDKLEIAVLLFVMYQLMDATDPNVFIDLIEFIVGIAIGLISSS